VFNAKFIYPMRNAEQAARYKQSGSGGLLLYGPPGTGKTLLVRALAGEMGAPVYTVKPSEIMSKWVGEAEQNMAALFAEAASHPVSLVFIDEIDALLPARGGEGGGVMERLVPQILAELDGFERRRNRMLFLGATNEPWAIDRAVLRPGRLDELCYVDLPDQNARRLILESNLDGVPLAQDVDIAHLAEACEGYTGADLFGLAMKATQAAYLELIETGNERPVSQEDFEQVMQGMRRTVTPEMLARYQAFRQGKAN
jgi:transitional endoplasmic reticulum ATPase